MEDLQQRATRMADSWISKGLYTKTEFSKLLGMSRPTLNSRLENGNWRKKEIDIVLENCPF